MTWLHLGGPRSQCLGYVPSDFVINGEFVAESDSDVSQLLSPIVDVVCYGRQYVNAAVFGVCSGVQSRKWEPYHSVPTWLRCPFKETICQSQDLPI